MPEEQRQTVHTQPQHGHDHITDLRPVHSAPVHHQPQPHQIQHQQAAVHHQAQHAQAVPQPPTHKSALPTPSILQPTPVVKMWTTRGLEYAMMIISLWITAAALAWLIIALINDSNSFVALASPVSALAVAVPVFTFFFIRLKLAEARNPILRADPSRRRWTQITQFLAFAVVLLSLIGLVREAITRYASSGGYNRPFTKMVLDSVTVLCIALIILVYYWIDEHRPIKR